MRRPGQSDGRRNRRPRIAFLTAILALTAVAGTRAGDEPAKGDFHLRSGEAAVRLREFAEQSGRQVIFPTELVQGLRTPDLDGRRPVREALEELLAGNELTVWEDPQTGALAIGRKLAAPAKGPPKPEAAILLPPFLVEDLSVEPWRYARVGDLEVLSRAADTVTAGLIEQIRTMRALLDVMLPPKLQGRSDVPTSCLIFARERGKGVPAELLARLEERTRAAATARHSAGDTRAIADLVGVLPNYRFWDHDSHAIFFVWDDLEATRMMPTPDYVRYLLESRTPTLPRWYIEGFVELYRSTIMYTRSIKEQSTSASSSGRSGPGGFEPDTLHVKRVIWGSEAITQRLQQARARGGSSAFATELHLTDMEPLPLAELFRGPAAEKEEPTLTRRRAETAALLIRRTLDLGAERPRLPPETNVDWHYAGGTAGAALVQLVERGCTSPVTEQDFQACFGVSFAVADADLMAYLPHALDNSVKLRPGPRQPADPVELRDAQPDEVARMRGGFGRLEVRYVAALYPELASRYLAQARHALQAAYSAGDRDPRLLAELGLCEVDANNDAGAAPYLDAAVAARVVRPRAYLELARIRLASLRAGGSDAKLTARETEAVLEPLWRSRSQHPALPEAYELMAETWLRSSAAPESTQLEALAEGARLFPQRTRLTVLTALVYASQRQWTAAQHYVSQGLAFATTAHDRERLEQLARAIQADRDGAR